MTQSRLVGGRYELGELIGYGGMAEVHRGRDSRLGRDVAIKVLRPDLARDPSFLNRFRREAQAAAGLNHPSIVSVYDTGEDSTVDGAIAPYIVMEHVEGRTLRDILKAEGRLPVRRAMEIAADVCGALDFSHKNGLIHRDVKPANVMITEAGAVKVMDFGIARAIADNSATVTQTANVIGTAQYLSPEQARGESVDARSDVYSTGCLLYELVTGVPPFQGDSPVAVAYQHVRENASTPSSRVPELPRALDSIVMKALAKNQLNRYQSAGEMRTDLQRALADQPVAAESVMTDAERTQFIARTPPPPVVLPPRDSSAETDEHPSRTGLVWAAIVVALLIVIGTGIFFIYHYGGSKSTPPAPKKVGVPTVIGDSPASAAAKFRNVNLKFAPDPTGNTTNGPCDDGSTPKQDGGVCKLLDRNQQNVAVGSQIDTGTTVFYQTYVQAKVNVPSVEGKSFSDAVNTLRTAGLGAVRKNVNSDTTQGQVLKQNPQVNTAVAKGSRVTLTVSTGKLKLPDVTGTTDGKARNILNGKGFTDVQSGQTTTTRDQSKDGLVAREDPTPGLAYAPSTTRINLTLYRYVAPPPPPPSCTTETPTPTTTTQPLGSPSPTGSLTLTITPAPTSTLPPCGSG
ncbi:MAG: Stk1 family PASTA domain-containing Ser/Thr kinase [Actinomycetota bacterium]|nr:Stk1 family PASTA domain-containing Ser/Thr kinase [Actinomycetota bacterium]